MVCRLCLSKKHCIGAMFLDGMICKVKVIRMKIHNSNKLLMRYNNYTGVLWPLFTYIASWHFLHCRIRLISFLLNTLGTPVVNAKANIIIHRPRTKISQLMPTFAWHAPPTVLDNVFLNCLIQSLEAIHVPFLAKTQTSL